jgi:hypothetical protein
VSMATAAYGWIYDQVFILVAIIQVARWVRYSNKYIYLFILIAFYVAINFLILVTNVSQFWFFWFAPMILLFYSLIQNLFGPLNQESV